VAWQAAEKSVRDMKTAEFGVQRRRFGFLGT